MDSSLFQVAAIQTEVTKQQHETEEDLAKAEPALQAANAALNTLNRVITRIHAFKSFLYICILQADLLSTATVFPCRQMNNKSGLFCVYPLTQLNLTELRTFPNPPAIVTNVSAAVLVLLSPQGRVPKDRSWKASKMVMSKVILPQMNGCQPQGDTERVCCSGCTIGLKSWGALNVYLE